LVTECTQGAFRAYAEGSRLPDGSEFDVIWLLRMFRETSGRGLVEYAFLASTFSVATTLAFRYLGPVFGLDGNLLESSVLQTMSWLFQRGDFFLW